MNYNKECRTVRGRVLNNCDACRTPRNCGCERNAVSQRADCGCQRNTVSQSSNCGCQRNTTTTTSDCENMKNDCGCTTNNTTGVVRESRNNACPRTVCTTVPVTEGCVDTYPVAMAYVPMQQWRELYDPASAISRGTIFRELDLEWYPTNCRKDCRRN